MPQLAPIVVAGGGLLSGFATFLQSGTIFAGIVKAGLALAANTLIGMAFASQAAAQTSSVEIQTVYGAAPPRSVILGTVGTAGRHAYRNFYGGGNRNIRDAWVLADWHISGINRVRYKGEWATVTPSRPGQFRYAGSNLIQGRHYLGLPSQAADATLISSSNPTGRWTADHRGDGLAYVSLYNGLDRENNPQPWEPFWEVRGWPLYDWRKDDTVGGTGGDRWNDPLTWTGRRDNPVLQMYGLERGFWRQNPVTGTFVLIVGKGIHQARLPLAEWTVAANICDELVEGDYRYKSNLIAKRGKGVTHASNMKPLLAACAASWVADASGEFPIVGANQAIVATFTDEDLMVDEDFRFSRYRPRSEMVNTISGQFSDPENFYDAGDYATKIDEAALAADGEVLETQIDFSALSDNKCVDRLSDIALRANRYQANADVCVRPKFLRVKPGRWVRWNSAKHGDRSYLVLRKRLGALGPQSCRNVYWTLQEVGPGVFDPTEYVTTAPDRIAQGAPDYQSELDAFHINPVRLVSPDGIERAAFKLTWYALEDTSVTHVAFRYWPVNQPDAVFLHPPVPAADLSTTIENSIVSRTEYAFQYWFVTDPPRTSVLSAPVVVRSVDTENEFYPIKLSQLAADVRSYQAWVGNAIRDAVEELRALGAYTSSEALASYSTVQKIRTELRAADDLLAASFTEEIIAATGPSSALASQIASLNATMGTKADTSTVSALSSRVDVAEGSITTQGSSITAIQTNLDTKAGTFVQTTAPTATATGDLWFDSANGMKPFRWSGSAWVAVQDIRAAETFAQAAAPTATATGDLWIDTSNNNRLWRWSGSAWVAYDDPRTTANAAAVSSLTSRVSTAETDIDAAEALIGTKNRTFRQDTAPAALAAGDIWLDTSNSNKMHRATAPGSASWVATDDARIAIQADAITALQGNYNSVSATATFRMGVSYTPAAGWTSRIGFENRVDTGSTFRSAGLYLESTVSQSRVVVDADQFAVLAGGTTAALFQTGTAYIDAARINSLDATNVTVSGRFDAALILQNGTVIEDLINVDTFSRFEPIQYESVISRSGGGVYGEGAWTHHGTVVVDKPADKPCIEFIKVEAAVSAGGTTSYDAYISVKRNGNSSNVAAGELFARARVTNKGGAQYPNVSTSQMRPPGETAIRYDIWTWNECTAGGSSSVTIRTTCDSGVWVFR